MAITAQVVKVTKPLASANEIVDADHWIVMHKDGGIIKRLSQEAQQDIMKIIEEQKSKGMESDISMELKPIDIKDITGRPKMLEKIVFINYVVCSRVCVCVQARASSRFPLPPAVRSTPPPPAPDGGRRRRSTCTASGGGKRPEAQPLR